MLPASNRGVGMNLCFPDVCLTPSPAGPVPIPYPNIALNMQAVGFSPVVKVSMMNALNLGSKIPMTTGDEAGSANPTIKGAGAFTMGNPLVFVDKMPAINLTSLATGNNMNAPIGAAIVPSVVNVFYTHLTTLNSGSRDSLSDIYARSASIEEALDLTSGENLRIEQSNGRVTFRIRKLGPEVPGQIYAALEGCRDVSESSVVLDVRQCRGGELDAFLRLAEMFLQEGLVLAHVIDEDGDEIEHRSRGGSALQLDLTVLIDGGTASAGELLAGTLRAHGRARLVGSRTYGKAASQCLRTTLDGASVFATSLRVLLPDRTDLEGCGLAPDEHHVDLGEAVGDDDER